MALILNNSRDVGNKFLFGHFMTNNSLAIPPSKRKFDMSKPWVLLTKHDKASDYDLDGEVFSYPNMGNVEGHRTWRIMDGSDDDLKISKSQAFKWIAKEMIRGANGIAIWVDGWTNSKNFLEYVGKICKHFKIYLIGFVQSLAQSAQDKLPDGYSNFEECVVAFNDIFDCVIVWNFEDNIISFKDTINNDWKNQGFHKSMGALQDAYSRESGQHGKHGAWVELQNGYAVWKSVAAWCVESDNAFCLYDPETIYKNEVKKIRLTLLSRIFKGTKSIPWQSISWGPDDPRNPMGTGEGADLDPDENQKAP